MPVIQYVGENTLRLKGRGEIQFRFVPGANDVSQDIWDHLLEHTDAGAWMSAGKLRVVMVPRAKPVSAPVSDVGKVPAKGPRKVSAEEAVDKVGAGTSTETPLQSLAEADVGKMSAPEAVSLVEGVLDLGILRMFQQQEENRKGTFAGFGNPGPRKTVTEAITKQIQIAELQINKEQASK